MCVDADMTDMTGTEIKAGFGDAARFTIGSQTMDSSSYVTGRIFLFCFGE